tara:strand:- start:1720 stop:2976 length:1257 start_codon:yes stop_codon:yes gene_type:complete
MEATLTPSHVLMTIALYINGFINGEYTLPVWQREDCWEEGYREALIDSILEGIDIPKIYIGNIIGVGKVIIDGGHRSRAIKAFLQNDFPVKIGDESVFYSKTRITTRSSRIMNEEEKQRIDNYKLCIYQYGDLSERKARSIFNKLQNAVPMSVPDVVNSFESPIIDYLRDFLSEEFEDGNTIKMMFKEIKAFPKPENSEDLYQLLSFATICWPKVTDDNQSEALKWIEKGTTRNSASYRWLKTFDDEFSEGVTDEMQQNFTDFLTQLIKILQVKNVKLPAADMNTLAHSLLWVPNFNVDLFWNFFEAVQNFKVTKSNSEKEFKKGNRDAATTLSISSKEMDDKYREGVEDNQPGRLTEWVNSRTSGGSNENGMRKRMEIVMLYCVGDVTSEEENDQEADGGRGGVLEQAEPVPTVTSL